MGNKLTITVWCGAFIASVAIACIAMGIALGWDLVPTSLSHLVDRGPVTAAILILFAVGLLINAINTVFVLRQLSLTSQGVTHVRMPNRERVAGRGLLGVHIDRLYDMYADCASGDISQASCLNAIRNQLFRREWIVRSASSLLLTLGLVGTVLGLTEGLGGLSSTVNSVASETLSATSEATNSADIQPSEAAPASTSATPDVSIGLNKALGGMASAFVTTLFGAVLGGVFLKLLCGCTDCLIEEVVDQIELTTEARVIPLLRQSPEEMLRRQERAFRKWAARMEDAALRECERLGQVSEQLVQITQRYARLSRAIAQAEAQLSGSRGHLALLSRLNTVVLRWDSLTKTRGLRAGIAACCIIAIVGGVRLIVDFVY